MALSMLRPGSSDLLGRFEAIERGPLPVWAWIVVVWALFVFPGIGLRSFYYEEGYIVAVARGALEDHQWVVPHLYGWRYPERPNLMALLVAGLGFLTGGINQWVARAPAVLCLLAGAFMVFHLVRRHAGALAALFGALCFLASPMMLQKAIVAEPDVLVSVILFGAFIVWWNGLEAGGIGIVRWLAIGVILAAAALVKGPQPIAYFGLGAFAYHLLRGQWLAILGLALSGIIAGLATVAWYWAVYEPGDMGLWLWHSRLGYDIPLPQRIADGALFFVTLLLEVMPALLLVAPFALVLSRPGTSRRDDLALALILYAACCTVVLLFWTWARGRYAMPAVFALAACAGLAFERLRAERRRLVNVALAIGALLATYQIVLSWLVMPAAPAAFERARTAAATISAIATAQPATVYAEAEVFNKNVLAYLHAPVRARVLPFHDLARVQTPAFVFGTPDLAQRLHESRPDLAIVVRATLVTNGTYQLIELRAK